MSSQHSRSFTVYQEKLGDLPVFNPAVGTPELDMLVDAYITQSMPLAQKYGLVSIQFFDSVDAIALNAGPVMRTFQLPIIRLDSTSSASARRFMQGNKRAREVSSSDPIAISATKNETSNGKRAACFTIMTKDGVDITECASRGPKTEEQRKHTALMRKLGACAKCKKAKQRCDPSHHGINAVCDSTSSSSASSSPAVQHFSLLRRTSSTTSSASPISSLMQPLHSTRSRNSRGASSISPSSPFDNTYMSFDNNSTNTLNLFFTGAESSAVSFTNFPFDATSADSGVEARREVLLQQQASVHAELAALPSTSVSKATGQIECPETMLFSNNDYPTDDNLNSENFESDPQGDSSVCDLTSSQTTPLFASGNSSVDGTRGTLTSPLRRRLLTPSFSDFFHGGVVVDAEVELNDHVPFDHSGHAESRYETDSSLGVPRPLDGPTNDISYIDNFLNEHGHLQQDFVLFPEVSAFLSTQQSFDSVEAGPDRDGRHHVVQDRGLMGQGSNVYDHDRGIEGLFQNQRGNIQQDRGDGIQHITVPSGEIIINESLGVVPLGVVPLDSTSGRQVLPISQSRTLRSCFEQILEPQLPYTPFGNFQSRRPGSSPLTWDLCSLQPRDVNTRPMTVYHGTINCFHTYDITDGVMTASNSVLCNSAQTKSLSTKLTEFDHMSSEVYMSTISIMAMIVVHVALMTAVAKIVPGLFRDINFGASSISAQLPVVLVISCLRHLYNKNSSVSEL